MPIVELKIPQLGEGLEQVFILELLKKEGDRILKDEPLYEMETDKATLPIESAYSGTVKQWLAKKGQVLQVGDPVVRLEVDAMESATATAETPPAVPSNKLSAIPPRTRAHGLKLGVSEEEMLRIKPAADVLLPSDIDTYLSLQRKR